MTEINNRVKLLRKIFRVMKAIPELVKTGVMQEGEAKQYGYHEADSIRFAFRAELLKQKLLCLPSVVQAEHWGNSTSTGGTYNYSQQLITFTFYDVDSGESIDCGAVGWGGDSLDKAAPKAAIQALKYFLTNGFFVKGIELDGDDPAEQLAGREANKQHQWFTGKVDAYYADVNNPWVMIEGNRLFAGDKKIAKQLRKLADSSLIGGPRPTVEDPTAERPWTSATVKIRTYMGQLNGNGVNPYPLIDKIEVIPNEKPLSAALEVPTQEAEPSAWPGDSLR